MLTYALGTFSEKARSIAYFTSAAVTSRFTGGLKCTPRRIGTVTVLLSAEIVGWAAARSGDLVVSAGL